MSDDVKRTGETDLEVSLEFPDAKMRADFEVAFRAWLKEYQQRAATDRLVGALATRMAEAAGEEDVAGYIYKHTTLDQKTGLATTYYLDLIGGW